MRPAKRSDGSDYYEYILLYTDHALVVSDNAEQVLRNELGQYFMMKEESIDSPKMYLGGHVRKVQFDNGVECWAFSSSQYVQSAVKNVEEYLSKRDDVNWKLPTKAETPLQTSYRPKLDVSPELKPIDAALQ
jgi:iron only hydrogenase large subunit-like protein